jgi:predicted PurR-regulated permease PerM
MNIEVPITEPLPRNGRTLRRIARIRNEVRVIRGCLIFLTVVAGFAAAVAASSVLAPTAIAIVLALVLAPVARTLERAGLPSGLSAVMAVAVTFLALGAFAYVMAPDVEEWMDRAPEITREIEQKLHPLKEQIAAVDSVSQSLTNVGGEPQAPAAAPPANGGLLSTAMREAPAIIAKIVYVTILTVFLLACRRRYTEQLILMPRRFSDRCRMSRICRDVRLRVSSYLFTLAMINAGLAAITALCFHLIGVADPLIWGAAFGILNFIPVIGPTAVIFAAALVGFATGDTLADALAPPLILLGINTIEANLVQPWLLSRRIVLSPIAIFVMVALLLWMWGAAAAITAVPLLIFFQTISLHVPSLRAAGRLLATEYRSGEGARNEQNFQPKKIR